MRKLAAVTLLCCTLAGSALAAGYRNVTSGEARRFLASHRNAYLLDVRTPEEFRQARLKGAVLIPVNEIERRYAEVPKNRPVVVYCAIGSRSSAAAGFLATKGYREIYNMADGIVGWYRNGYPLSR